MVWNVTAIQAEAANDALDAGEMGIVPVPGDAMKRHWGADLASEVSAHG